MDHADDVDDNTTNGRLSPAQSNLSERVTIFMLYTVQICNGTFSLTCLMHRTYSFVHVHVC